jgi:hypothetical protein
LQNLAPATKSDPHFAQDGIIFVPHELQNFESAATGVAHFGQGIGIVLPQLLHLAAFLSLSSPHSGHGFTSSAQLGQNFDPRGIFVPHLSHDMPALTDLFGASKLLPHLPQKRVPGGFGVLQL